jgi:hypothetical protein
MGVGSNIGPVTMYRTVRRSALLGKSRKIAILRSGSQMELVKPEKAVLIDRGVDALVVRGVALFVDRRAFQRVFGFLEQIQEAAATTFDEVTADLRIEGLTDLRAAATTQLAMLGKMASIARKLREHPGYREALTMGALVSFVRANPQTGVEIEGEGDEARLVFRPDVQHRFKILKLLDDDYLRSQLTQLDYEANSKSAPLG